MVYALQGDHELGRNESRLGELLDSRDYCKLHIALHYIARLHGLCAGSQIRFRYGRSGWSATMRREARSSQK